MRPRRRWCRCRRRRLEATVPFLTEPIPEKWTGNYPSPFHLCFSMDGSKMDALEPVGYLPNFGGHLMSHKTIRSVRKHERDQMTANVRTILSKGLGQAGHSHTTLSCAQLPLLVTGATGVAGFNALHYLPSSGSSATSNSTGLEVILPPQARGLLSAAANSRATVTR